MYMYLTCREGVTEYQKYTKKLLFSVFGAIMIESYDKYILQFVTFIFYQQLKCRYLEFYIPYENYL